MRLLFVVIVIVILVGRGGPAHADHPWTPIGLTLFEPYSVRGDDDIVAGLDLGFLYTRSFASYGLDVSVGFNSVAHEQAGLQIAGIGSYAERALGSVQLAFGVNITGESTAVLQVAGIANAVGHGFAIQLAPGFNFARDASGVQVGALNVAIDRYRGVQLGGLNVTGAMKGLQLGVFNYAETLVGVQIGLVNIVEDSSLPFTVLVNAGW